MLAQNDETVKPFSRHVAAQDERVAACGESAPTVPLSAVVIPCSRTIREHPLHAALTLLTHQRTMTTRHSRRGFRLGAVDQTGPIDLRAVLRVNLPASRYTILRILSFARRTGGTQQRPLLEPSPCRQTDARLVGKARVRHPLYADRAVATHRRDDGPSLSPPSVPGHGVVIG